MLDMNTNMQTNGHEYKYKLIETKEKIESKPRETKKKLSSTKQLHQAPLHVLFSSRRSDRYRMGSSINWGSLCWNKHAMHGCVAGVCVVCVGAMQLSCCANRSPGLGAERMHGCCVQAAVS